MNLVPPGDDNGSESVVWCKISGSMIGIGGAWGFLVAVPFTGDLVLVLLPDLVRERPLTPLPSFTK